MDKKVITAISGGLDSSMTAYFLKEKGYDQLGVFLRLTEDKDEDEDRARRVCAYLGIRFYPIDAQAEFQKKIIDDFLGSYGRGETPNPCVMCNKKIKIDILSRVASGVGASYVATGHYARAEKRNGKYRLLKGRDEKKDQSYFLYRLGEEDLSRIIFPLGERVKEEVREIADREAVPYKRGESQDICFLSGDHNNFLKKHLGTNKGEIRNLQDEVIGEHEGLYFYTIGQRRGIELGGGKPYYVANFDHERNILYVTDRPNDQELYSDKFTAGNLNWVAGEPPGTSFECGVVIRYGHKEVPCRIEMTEKGEARVVLGEEERAITAGQSAVFYSGDEILGGGIIKNMAG